MAETAVVMITVGFLSKRRVIQAASGRATMIPGIFAKARTENCSVDRP